MADIGRVEFETLIIEKNHPGGFAVVTLNRPDKLNAGSPTMMREIAEVMHDLDGDDSVAAVLITGGSGRAFSAGADLGGMTFDDTRDRFSFMRICSAAYEAIERVPKVVVAAVNGYAFGFGLELALSCDLVLASDRATFGSREMEHGLVPIFAISRGVDVIGRRRAAWLAFTAEDLSAQDALDFGLVNKVIPHDELEEEALALVGRMARRPLLAVATAKRVLNSGAAADYRMAENVMPGIFGSEDVSEGRKAFEERRAPAFRGR